LVHTAENYDGREHPRDEVQFRARARHGDAAFTLTVVNLSPQGFMARADGLSPGDMLSVTLPGLGEVDAEVRWSLGGRIGCRLARLIGADAYRRLLEAASSR